MSRVSKNTAPSRLIPMAAHRPKLRTERRIKPVTVEQSKRQPDAEQLNQYLEVALNNMGRGITMFDAEQRLILCNEAYRELYDLPVELTRPGTRKLAGMTTSTRMNFAAGSMTMWRVWRSAKPSGTPNI